MTAKGFSNLSFYAIAGNGFRRHAARNGNAYPCRWVTAACTTDNEIGVARLAAAIADQLVIGGTRQTAPTREASAPRSYALSRARPLARRALMTARPPTVRMRARNPCVRLRFNLLGWYVRFIFPLPRVSA